MESLLNDLGVITTSEKAMERIVFRDKVLNNVKKFFPDLAIKFTRKYHISPRIIMPYVKKTDKRISKIEMVKKNYLKILTFYTNNKTKYYNPKVHRVILLVLSPNNLNISFNYVC